MTITRDQIIAWARKAGLRLDKHNGGFVDQSELIRFAALIEQAVRQDERELCAKAGQLAAINGIEVACAIRERQGTKND